MKISLLQLEKLIKFGYTPKINTVSGMEYITDVYRKSGDGVLLTFSDNTTIKASNYHQVLYNGAWTCCKDLVVGDNIDGKDIVNIEPVECQEWIDFTIDADHQSYIHDGITHHNSGKSLILYGIVRFFIDHDLDKGLLIVPNVSLCNQLFSDFDDYSSHNNWKVEDYVHIVYSGKEKFSDHKLMLSTWQSLSSMLKNKAIAKDVTKLFHSIDYVISDECHLSSSTEVSKILNSCINASYRLGVTGTLNGTKIHSLQLEALFGRIEKVITTKELMDRGQVTKLHIKTVVLKYPEDIRKSVKGLKYQEEIGFIISNRQRNNFIKNLLLSLKGNSLLLYQYVETHGEVLYKLISESKHAKDHKVYLIHGNIKPEERERIRHAMEHEQNVILIGSVGTVSTGTNIRNLHNIVFASPSKSRIRNLQAIGRVLRLADNKSKATLYDIADDFRYKKHVNYTMLHLLERIKIYDSEKFDYKLINVELK